MSARPVLLLAACLGLVCAAATPVHATFPGTNGKIAVRQSGPPHRIATINPDGSAFALLTSGSDSYPAWSPDGERLAFYRSGTDGRSLFVVRSDGSEQELVAGGLTSGTSGLTWSPDGRRIAVESPRDTGALRIFDLNGGYTDLRVQPQGRTIFVNNPDWSPDGTKIAVEGKFWELICDEYDPYYCDLQYSTSDLYALEADGSGISRLTFDASLEEHLHDNSAPSWSPDGARIAFKRDAGIAVMDADGGDMHELVDSGGDPVWSPDGTKLAFGRNGAVFVVNADGSGQTKILDGAPFPATSFYSPSWQPVPNRSPDCSGVTADPSQLWPPNKKLRPVTVSGARDPDGDAVTLEVAGVTQDEPAGRDADWDVRDDGTVLLRAERDPQGDGRVYTVVFQVTDEHGGSCTATATVSVPRHKR